MSSKKKVSDASIGDMRTYPAGKTIKYDDAGGYTDEEHPVVVESKDYARKAARYVNITSTIFARITDTSIKVKGPDPNVRVERVSVQIYDCEPDDLEDMRMVEIEGSPRDVYNALRTLAFTVLGGVTDADLPFDIK